MGETVIWLLLASIGVGLLIGAVGIGGILLIPALSFLAGLGIHEAMATALFTFIVTGVVGTLLFQRRGSIDWRITTPICVGAVVFGFVGAFVNSKMSASALSVFLAALIIFAGVYTLAGWNGMQQPVLYGRPGLQQIALLAMGAFAGFGSGLTGVGGPALLVPVMVLFGFPALVSIGASQVIQILAAASGTLGNLRYGAINFGVAAMIIVFEVIGVLIGVRIAHALNADVLRRFVALLCIVVGMILMPRALGMN